MKSAQLLDCTLRDGAYLVDKDVGDENIHNIIRGLVEARVEWIELGFLQDEGAGNGSVVFQNSKDAERYIPRDKGRSRFTAFADYSRYSIENLDDYTGKSFDAVRACFYKHERNSIKPFCDAIKKKGYKLFIQPVDILGYTDEELLDLIFLTNEIKPYCLSIVDTFGSMYEDDLQRVFMLIDHNLDAACKIGFHSHNNMQLSNALAQSFIKRSYGRRNIVVDGTINGMGRGAGNTPTELVIQYLVAKWKADYDIDPLLDVIDTSINNLRTRCSWGYSTPFFIAGAYGAHVNNVTYLLRKNGILSKDIRCILEQMGDERKRYHYDLLDKKYLELVASNADNEGAIQRLRERFSGRNVVIVAPGGSVARQTEQIRAYIRDHSALVVAINFVPKSLPVDMLYISNIKRYKSQNLRQSSRGLQKIITNNVKAIGEPDEFVVSFQRLFKRGWTYADNSTIMLLRLLDLLGVGEIGIAGLDGYDRHKEKANYANASLELSISLDDTDMINQEILEMLLDFLTNKKNVKDISFITESRFEACLSDNVFS